TLAMIVAREEEIRKFVPKDYWTITAQFNGFTVQWQDRATNQTRTFSKEQADGIVRKITGQTGEIVEVRKDMKKELPPLAYDLTELQRDANRKYSYSAKQTLNIMQKLYETHKLVTYPRTDSRYITEDIVPTLAERLRSIAVGPYARPVQGILRNKLSVTKRFVDNSKVSDHHAIIPTEQYVNLSALSTEERNIYDLIVKRFIAVLSSPFEYEQTTVRLDLAGENFTARGKIVRAWGWKTVYEGFGKLEEDGEEEEDDQSLPEIQKGQKAKVLSPKAVNGKTKPPARYNEATLLSAMEHPGKFVDNKALKETLESTSGLGTPATRADIIEKLFNTFYIERRGKEIHPTSKGIQLVGLVPEDLKSPELTAKWEQQLALISKGRVSSAAFVGDMKSYASKLVGAVIANSEQFRHDNVTREKCAECGKYLLEVNGKKGKMLVCPDRECGYRKTVTLVSNARCPQCHKKMEIRGEGDNKSFYCACGYREKLDTLFSTLAIVANPGIFI
ncbi:DNA topoisomerase III, partial [Ruminiclostridium cellobioparum]|uniref:DNA topoisomerase III n=1 Tax=Ruminiclostridium cellobioparum TaxID=29355 RepID=UPI0028AC86FD